MLIIGYQNMRIKMKEIVIFLLGAVVGAFAALLLAPESGEELRASFRTRVDEELPKLRSEWQAAMNKTEARLEQIEADLKKATQG